MKKSATIIAIVALGAMLAAGSATESMAHGGGGGHGGGSHGGGSHGSGGSHASHEGHSGERGRHAPNTDDGEPSPMDNAPQSYLFGSPLFR